MLTVDLELKVIRGYCLTGARSQVKQYAEFEFKRSCAVALLRSPKIVVIQRYSIVMV